ncbi:MAG: response regulator [Chloroflexota bacterium]
MVNALIVEDEKALQLLYTRLVESCGYAVASASNGHEAIAHLQRAGLPNLILLDIRMPHSNGHDVLCYLQEHPDVHNVHVVIVTASREFARYTSMVPSSEFVLKPLTPPVLKTIADKCAHATT